MKVIKSDSPKGVYQQIFKQVQTNNSVMVVWQLIPETGERKITDTRLNSFHLDSRLLHFEMQPDNPIISQLPIYCFCESSQFIFKSDIQSIKSNVLSIILPVEIQMLEEADIEVIKANCGSHISTYWRSRTSNSSQNHDPDFLKVKSMSERTERDQEFLTNEFSSMSLDEEDKFFADKRETPRARPKNEKWVKIKTQSSDEVDILKLFDLSQGGIGFITHEVDLYPKGCEIQVVGFEEFDLDHPLVGKVMSQRPIDEHQIEYKIGVKFNEGQD